MKRVLLIGIWGTYNYGCEAIIRGTVNIIKQYDPKIDVYYASYNAPDDKKRLNGCNVNIIERPKKKKWTISNIIKKTLSLFKINYDVPYDKTGFLKDFDTVFSIGGDLYTLNPDGSFDRTFPMFLEKCQKMGIKYILWGASVGSFEKNKLALNFFLKHLPKIDLIYVREPNTLNYLKKLNVTKNVIYGPDPAFFVRKDDERLTKLTNQFTIGINLSPLSAYYIYNNLDIAINTQSESICNLIEALNCNIILIPHVLSNSPQDDDFSYLKKIYILIKKKHPENVTLIDSDPLFCGLKPFFQKCNIVIAARMHCAINSITCGTPALFLSYSEKAKGMSEFVYGTEIGCVNLNELENTNFIIERINNLPNIDLSYLKYDFNSVFKGILN